MPGNVVQPAPAEFKTRERCFIREYLNDPATPGLSVARARVEPGVTTECHRLSVDEWYIILSGEGRVFVGDSEPQRVGPDDVVRIPAGTAQHIENTGADDLVFQCVCQPRFTPDAYQALEGD